MDEHSQSMKRRLDTNLETSSLPAAKQARLFETNLQQPAPKHPRASFLEDHVGLTDTIFEWLESIGSDPEKRCRSDSYLHHSSDDPISRNLTRSAPQMAYKRDADGYALPRTPGPSYGSVVPSDAVSSRSSRALVEGPLYRDLNLASNHVYMRERYEQFPEHVSSLIDHVRRDRESPGPSFEEVCFLLQKPQDYIEFRKLVKNVIDWGKDKRLKEIRESLDTLLEESQKQASKAAKSRPPPTKDSTSKSKKHNRPPSRKRAKAAAAGTTPSKRKANKKTRIGNGAQQPDSTTMSTPTGPSNGRH
ncbi:hypothetical protein FALBO_5582 [Fusarium albosuccineum]|uniref:Uncharacterized protein n=1 Tax=Fusarium albosuccineum TaxID=1237068 RepID=A0A8H4LG85_9HYPO|nr:hypothetical protein FALBO_5582 [Fusarium albosuccineum]